MFFSINNFHISTSSTLFESTFFSKWNSLEPDNTLTKYYHFLESVKPVDITFIYIVIEKDIAGKRVVCGKCYVHDVLFKPDNVKLTNPFLGFLCRFFLRIRPFRMFIYGNVFAVDFPTVSFEPSLISREEFAKLLVGINEKYKSDVLILKDLPHVFQPELMSSIGLEKYSTDLTMTMKIRPEWNSLADYTSALTKKYRKRAMKIMEKGKALSKRMLSFEEISERKIQINELLNQVAKNQLVRIGILDGSYLEKYMAQFPDVFKITGVFLDDQMVGFYSRIDRGEMLEIHYIGMDYKLNESHLLYFNMLFYALEDAILEKRKLLELGRTAREAKASLGCKPEYFNDYLRINNAAARFLANRLTGFFQAEMGNTWLKRHPFSSKNASSS